jgi:hypothetical protein
MGNIATYGRIGAALGIGISYNLYHCSSTSGVCTLQWAVARPVGRSSTCGRSVASSICLLLATGDVTGKGFLAARPPHQNLNSIAPVKVIPKIGGRTLLLSLFSKKDCFIGGHEN